MNIQKPTVEIVDIWYNQLTGRVCTYISINGKKSTFPYIVYEYGIQEAILDLLVRKHPGIDCYELSEQLIVAREALVVLNA